MSKGDKLIGIPTTYKGVEMRSKLETKITMFLDYLKIKWEYEPKKFLLGNGISYIPDFYLNDMKVWIEVKGLILKHNKEISERFVGENKTELLMVSNIESVWFSSKDFTDGIGIDENVYIGFCSNCKKYFFCSNLGSYHCRNCGKHEGDHDLLYTFNSDDFFDNDKINFYDLESIKTYLENHCGIKLGDKNGDSISKV